MNITKADLVEMKSLSAPPTIVKRVAAATMVLLEISTPYDTRNPDDSRLWGSFKKAISRQTGDESLAVRMSLFDAKKISPEQLSTAKNLIEGTSTDAVKKVSTATTSLYQWVAKAIADVESCQATS